MEPGDPPPRRISVEERAARRDRIARTGTDRYASLLHTLQAGREVTGSPTGRRTSSWHPIAGKLLVLAGLVVSIYLIATVATRLWRESVVDTWSGPDTSVTSGQRLDGCAALPAGSDVVFPRWVRFQGRLYVATGLIRPIGANESGAYEPTGYRLHDVELYRITDTPEGRAGATIVLKLERVPTGQLFREAPECA